MRGYVGESWTRQVLRSMIPVLILMLNDNGLMRTTKNTAERSFLSAVPINRIIER